MTQSTISTMFKSSILIVFYFFSVLSESHGQICSDYTDWIQATYNNGDVINLSGKLYTPCYSSTSAPLSDAWARDEGGCGTTQWGFVSTCSSCTRPTITASSGGSRCGTGTVSIQATSSGGSIEWFSASSGGSSIGSSSSGVNWTTPSISSTTTYYAEGLDDICTSTSRTAVTATVTTIPTVSGSNDGARSGTGTVVIQASSSVGTIDWFAASSGGSSIGSSSSGVDWTTPSISVTTIYHAEAVNGSCLSASRTPVSAAVGALPVELLCFNAKKQNDVVVLNWVTAAEINNDYFVIEKSSDGVSWEFLNQVDGAGNTSASINYSSIDYEGCFGICYYRLKQVDFDGSEEIYKAIIVDEKGGLGISVNPNPIQDQANVIYHVPMDGSYRFKIVSFAGQLVYDTILIGVEGSNYFTMDFRLSRGGYYFILLDNEENSVQQKVLKK